MRFSLRSVFMLALSLAVAAAGHAQKPLPSGTILPVSLDTSMNTARLHAGQPIRATVMQNVPGTPVRRGSRVYGQILQVDAPHGGPVRLVFTFDSVQPHRSKQRIPLKASLRAVASFNEVEDAQVPTEMASRGLNPENWTTQQIGGEMVYRGGGPVARGDVTVGKPTPYGVLVLPRVQHGQPCRGVIGQNRKPQALWLFSSDACGVFGLESVRLQHAGRTQPDGEFVLISPKGRIELGSGTGMLLRVLGS